MNLLITILTHALAAIAGAFVYRNNPFKTKAALDLLEARAKAEAEKLKGGK